MIPAPFNSTLTNNNLNFLLGISIANNGAPLGSRIYSGTFNVTNSDLVLVATDETTALSNYANVADMLRSGFDGGDWLGKGITSSVAALDHSDGYNNIAIGVLLNDDGSHINADGSGDPIWPTFEGSALNQYDVIVKYTFYGDLNLSGSVSRANVITTDSNIGTGQGWSNGQFFYNGSPTSFSDVVAANKAYYLQGDYPLTVPVSSIPSVPPFSAPEPTPLALAGTAIGLLASKVWRRRTI